MVSCELTNISDNQLNLKLLEYGLPLLPVTETTRDVLLKKLSKLQTLQKSVYSQNSNRQAAPDKTLQNTLEFTHPLCVRNTPKPIENTIASMSSPNTNGIMEGLLYQPSPKDIHKYNHTMQVPNAAKHPARESGGIVNRLLNLRDKTIRTQSTHLKPFNNIGKCNFYTQKLSKRNVKVCGNRKQMLQMANAHTSAFSSQNFIPYILMSTFAIFIISLALIYIRIIPDSMHLIETNKVKTLNCPNTSSSELNCVHEKNLEATIDLVKELYSLLQGEQSVCKMGSKISTLPASDFIHHISSNRMHKEITSMDIEDMVQLLKLNPEWKIESAYENLRDNYENELIFIYRNSNLSISCSLYNKFKNFFAIIGIGLIIGVLLRIAYNLYKNLSRKQIQYTMTVNTLIKSITEEIQRSAMNKNTSEHGIVVNHLRDKLIPVNKREKMNWAWDKALKTIETCDSRVAFGITELQGQEFRTIKWIGSTVMEQRKLLKEWQSPAFNNAVFINPPTQCLKIRHMFDSSEIAQPHLKEMISDSIIRKVGPNCKILDIQLDLRSCCVYVRCATETDAGIVHNQINGWWFDNRLVSIKFLRLQRYLARFPTSNN